MVENPATSSPGLAFMLGDDRPLRRGGLARTTGSSCEANGVEVATSWDEAYYTDFSGSSGKGPKPIVVSYGSSPPAEVIFAETPLTEAPTAVVDELVLPSGRVRRGARGHEARRRRAQRFIDFMVEHDVPGRHAAQHVRVPGEHEGRAAGRVREVLASCPTSRCHCPPTRSRRTATSGSTSGPTVLRLTRIAARVGAPRAPARVPRRLLRVAGRHDHRDGSWARKASARSSPTSACAASRGSRCGRRRSRRC